MKMLIKLEIDGEISNQEAEFDFDGGRDVQVTINCGDDGKPDNVITKSEDGGEVSGTSDCYYARTSMQTNFDEPKWAW